MFVANVIIIEDQFGSRYAVPLKAACKISMFEGESVIEQHDYPSMDEAIKTAEKLNRQFKQQNILMYEVV